MPSPARELAQRLARDPEAVCRHYLSAGRRQGRYWLVGDLANTPGRSLYVRLRGPAESGRGAAGKWTDAATGQHGDLLDLIAGVRSLTALPDVLDEARRFLSLPRAEPRTVAPSPRGSPEAARRLFAISKPIRGTLAEAYLRERGITALRSLRALRFHPRCYYRPDIADPDDTCTAWPAMIAAVIDEDGLITGVHRTWLDPSGRTKAPVATPRRAMGGLLGGGVRFGAAGEVMAAGEGIETVLSLRSIMPTMPIIAALSAGHLAALAPPANLRRLYIVQDDDAAGRRAAEALTRRAQDRGIEALTLKPGLDDFNEDLQRWGARALAADVRVQLAPEDVARFLDTRAHDPSDSPARAEAGWSAALASDRASERTSTAF